MGGAKYQQLVRHAAKAVSNALPRLALGGRDRFPLLNLVGRRLLKALPAERVERLSEEGIPEITQDLASRIWDELVAKGDLEVERDTSGRWHSTAGSTDDAMPVASLITPEKINKVKEKHSRLGKRKLQDIGKAFLETVRSKQALVSGHCTRGSGHELRQLTTEARTMVCSPLVPGGVSSNALYWMKLKARWDDRIIIVIIVTISMLQVLIASGVDAKSPKW